MSDDIPDQRAAVVAIVLFGAIVGLIVSDLIADYAEGAGWGHLAVELVVLIAAALSAGLLWVQLRRSRSDLAAARAQAAQWREENRMLLQGLGAAIDRQFRRWQLTRAEAEIGLLLLKGLSHKEIATVRRTSERTIREQAPAMYRKSGLAGRASLAAFFLEDLLLPESADAGLRAGENGR